MTVWAPQPGPQTAFLATPADVAIYGGAAGGGKTHALKLEVVRHHDVPGFDAAIFRRKTPQLLNPGGLWDKSADILRDFRAHRRGIPHLDARFPSGALVKYGHLEKENDVENYQGSELAFIGYDELTHFLRRQFIYMLSRNRSTCGVRPYTRATCNPDPNSFVLDLVRWYLDDEGYPHPEKSGLLRYFSCDGDAFVWGSRPEEVLEQVPHLGGDRSLVMSFTFIPARLEDNPALLKADPAYKAKMATLTYVDRLRLGGGNWFVKETAGTMFRKEWFTVVEAPPADAKRLRYWDLAGTKRKRSDYTAGVRLSFEASSGRWFIEHIANIRGRPFEVEQLVRRTAEADTRSLDVWIEQELASAAIHAIDNYQRRVLPGWNVRGAPVRDAGNKVERAKAFSSAAEAGNVVLVRGAWNEQFLSQAELFPDGLHDDMVDACSGAFGKLAESDMYWRSV